MILTWQSAGIQEAHIREVRHFKENSQNHIMKRSRNYLIHFFAWKRRGGNMQQFITFLKS